MKTVQMIGLNKRARDFIKRWAIVTASKKCPTCGHGILGLPIWDNIGFAEGMIGDGAVILRRFGYSSIPFENHRYFEEYEQILVGTLGMKIYLALRWSDTKEPIEETLWRFGKLEQCLDYDFGEGIVNGIET